MVARTLDGREVTGSVSELSGGRVVLKTAEGSTTIQPDQLLGLRPQNPPKPSSDRLPVSVELVDGSRLMASDFNVTDGQVTLNVRDATLTGSSKAVSIARFKPETPAAKVAWAGFLKTHKDGGFKGDVLIVTKGDTVDFFEGVLHDTGNDKDANKIIKFEVDGEVREVRFDRVDGLIYLKVGGDAEPTDPVCILSDTDGSQLRLKSIALKDGRLDFETLAGLKGSRPLEEVTDLNYSAGKIAYLAGDHEADSDELSPLRKPVWRSPIDGWRPPQAQLDSSKPRSKNRWLPGDEMKIPGGQVFKRGLCIKGGWEIEYALRGQYRRFHAIAAVDLNMSGAADLVIEADGKKLFEGEIREQQPPKALDLDVSGVRILKIRAIRKVPTQDGVIDLCEARVSK
jgi:hypothetical protein